MLGVGAALHYMQPDKTLGGLKVLRRPVVLEAASASCIYGGCNLAYGGLGIQQIIELADHVPFAVLNQQPDDGAPNRRVKVHIATALPDHFFMSDSKCVSHQGHRCIQAT